MVENFLKLQDRSQDSKEREKQNMIREAIVKLVNKENLTYEMAEGAMDEIMGGKADPIQISAF